MVPSFFSLFGPRRDERPDESDTPLAPDRPARPPTGAPAPRLDTPESVSDEEGVVDQVPDAPTTPDAPPDPDAPPAPGADPEAHVDDSDAPDEADDETVEPDSARAEAGDGPATELPPADEAARTRAVHAAADAWRDELLALGSASTLADIGLLGGAVLDLSHAHPSGLASLYAGRRTQLRNIVREPSNLERARHSARIVQVAATELTHRFGIAPTFLAVGVATWHLPAGRALPGLSSGDHLPPRGGDATALATQLTMADLTPHLAAELNGAGPREGGDGTDAQGRPLGASGDDRSTLRVPVLLRPVRLLPRDGSGDVDLQLEPSVEINPVLVSALREAGIDVDLTAIAGVSFAGAGFAPREALATLRDLGTAALPGFELHDAIVVGTFLDPGQVLLDDLASVRFRLPDSDVLAAIAGDEHAARTLLGAELPAVVPGDRAPEEERGVGDLDAHDHHVLDTVAAGHDVFIDAPVGSHPDRLVAALLADAAQAGRRTLYLPSTKRVGRAVLDRLTAVGLEDVALQIESDPGWQARAATQLRRSVAAREVDLDDDALTARRDEWQDVRGRLARYIDHLHAVREPWGVSVHEAMQQLARLSASTPPPLTSVRLAGDVLIALRDEAGADVKARLRSAALLGAFSVGAEDTPWYGARVTDEEEAAAALERARRLAAETLPRLLAQVANAARETGLREADNLASWAEHLHLLDDVAGSLDVFVPQIYERPVDRLVVATAPRAWRREHGEQMGSTERRELRRTALELVRPGRSVGDVHAELLEVHAQQATWRTHAPEGGWPRLPQDLAAMRATERAVRADLDALAGVLARRDEPLTTMPLTELRELMSSLAEDEEALGDVPGRAATVADLRERGLDVLLDDLAARTVAPAMVGPEFDQAWWSSVFQEMVSADPTLAGYDGPALDALVDRFRELDAARCASLAGPVRHRVVTRLREAVYADTDSAASLYHSLGSDGGGHLRQTFATWSRLCWDLRPVRAIAPMLVPQLLSAQTDVDLLVLDHPRRLATAQIAGAIGRAAQVVVVADARAGLTGAAADLGAVLPHVTLPTTRTDVAPDVMGFLAARGYGDVATVVPAPPSGPRVRLDVVTGEGTTGTPAPGADGVEAPPAEVEHVAALVARHAAERPEDSLGVVALTERHAVAIRGALRRLAREDDALHRFLTAERHENVVAISAQDAAGLSRDRIVLSVGFGKTVHGRVLHQFGPVSEPGGRATLIEALAAARHELVVVSCLAPGDIRSERVQAPGPQLLADLLELAHGGSLLDPPERGSTEQLPLAFDAQGRFDPDRGASLTGDQLLIDLSERLWDAGLRVVPRYGSGCAGADEGGGSERGPGEGTGAIALAVGPAASADELSVALVTDDAAYVAEPSLRTRDRHRVETLERRGWAVRRVFSAALFLDQQEQVERVVELDRRVREARTAEGGRALRLALAAESARTDPTTRPASDADLGAAAEADAATASALPPAQAGVEQAPRRGGEQDPASPPASAANGARRRSGAARPASEDVVRRRPQRPQPLPRGQRPDVPQGLGLVNYTDAQLVQMVRWIAADGLPRTEGQLVTELRAHLSIRDTGNAARAVLARAARQGRA